MLDAPWIDRLDKSSGIHLQLWTHLVTKTNAKCTLVLDKYSMAIWISLQTAENIAQLFLGLNPFLLFREAAKKNNRFFFGYLSQICFPTHPPQGFCEIWENER